MPLPKITGVTGRAVSVPGDDIDTDRIIPARFMKCVTFDGLGEFMFYDVRHDATGALTEHPLNNPKFAGATILLSGNNFGCGSSREHAPQALYRFGFRAVVAEGFAEIFFGNSTTLGMPCVSASKQDIAAIASMVASDPSLSLVLCLERMVLAVGGKEYPCTMKPEARKALIEGAWDPIGELLDGTPAVAQASGSLGYMSQ